MSKKISLSDIAQVAGVSIATVSYALNNSPQVSIATRQRISKLASEMNYQPNASGRGNRTRQSHMICMLINTFNSLMNAELVDDIREALLPYNYSLVVIRNSNASLIDSQMFDGLIIWNYAVPKVQIHRIVQRNRIPVVLMANELKLKNVQNIVLDNRNAIYDLFEIYEHSVHKKICFFRNAPTTFDSIRGSYNSEERLNACIAYMKDNHPETNVLANTYDGHFATKPAYELALRLLQDTAYNFFFCLNDMMAYGVYQAAQKLGLVVGKDISVVGFDNTPKSGEILPRLTTIDSELSKWGQNVVASLLTRLATPEIMINKTVRSPTKLIFGDSVRLNEDLI